MSNREVLVGLVKKFRISVNKLDDFCYEIYSLFRNYALSMAIERPSCSRIVVLGKDFEVRLHISHDSESVLTLFFTLLPEMSHATEDLERKLVLLFRTLSSMIITSSEPTVIVRSVIFSPIKSINHLTASLTRMGIVLESIDKKFINDFEILTLRGFYIGENLKRCSIVLSLITGERSELSMTVETRISEELLLNLNMFLNYVKKIYDFIIDLENYLINSDRI
jgi:hypothetical protein